MFRNITAWIICSVCSVEALKRPVQWLTLLSCGQTLLHHCKQLGGNDIPAEERVCTADVEKSKPRVEMCWWLEVIFFFFEGSGNGLFQRQSANNVNVITSQNLHTANTPAHIYVLRAERSSIVCKMKIEKNRVLVFYFSMIKAWIPTQPYLKTTFPALSAFQALINAKSPVMAFSMM